MTERNHLEQLADRMQMDIRALDKKLTELRSHIAQLQLPDNPPPTVCPTCGVHLKGPRRLAEHNYQLHGAPEPEHWEGA